MDPTLWTVGDNWSLGHYPGETGHEESAVFNVKYNNPCEVDGGAFPIVGLSWNQGYTAQIAIDDGIQLQTSSGFVSDSSSVANVNFATVNTQLAALGGTSTLYEFHFSGHKGEVYIDKSIQGTATLTLNGTFGSTSTAQFDIYGNLVVQNAATVTFQSGAGIYVASGGQMTVSGITGTMLAETGGGFIENGGTFSFSSTGATTIAMPFLDNGTATLSGGLLTFSQSCAMTNGYSYMMGAGTTVLENSTVLTASAGYYQTAGLLSIADTNVAEIKCSSGSVEIDGGKVQKGTATGFGQLDIGANFTLNGGELDMKIDGNFASSDFLSVNGLVNINSGKLVVTSIGAVTVGLKWKIIEGAAGSGGNGWTTTFPAGIIGSSWDAQNFYELDS
ncbi:MAG TPA: hypothetical protein VFA18_04475 [Gemmataceae bacterium]|nr:hypothetical protein [Gemmataceae bacterium]